MGLNILITLIILTGLGVWLMLFIRKNSQKKKEEALAELLKIAQEKDASITFYDTWGGYRTKTKIAADSEKFLLFFIKKIDDIEKKLVVDLSEIEKATLTDNTRWAGLELAFKVKNKPSLVLEFYNSEYDSLSESGELQLAEKWAGIINKVVA